MTSDSSDPWHVSNVGVFPDLEEVHAPTVRVDVVQPVEPLDRQIGIYPKQTVPDALRDVIFGQPAPSAFVNGNPAGSVSSAAPLQAYAILDASKVTGLPDLLETSGLEYGCLFKGDAYDEMKDVAP